MGAGGRVVFGAARPRQKAMKWYELNPGRLEIEKRLLAQCHPGSKLIRKSGQWHIVKRLVTRRDTYIIEGIFADDHPYSPMEFYVRQPPLKGSPPHRYIGDRLCLHEPDEVGPETTAKIYLDWAIQWIQTYERWLNGAKWPRTNRG